MSTVHVDFGVTATGRWIAWLRDRLDRFELTALRIAVIYTAFGLAALFVFDVLIVPDLSEPLLSQVQAVKGAVEVIASAVLIFALTRRSRRQLQDATAELRQKRDELDLLHRVFRHNLRNDVNIIQGLAGLAQDGTASPETRERCARIAATTEKMTRYIKQVRRVRQVTAEGGHLASIDLSTTLRGLLADESVVPPEVALSAEIPDSVFVLANPMLEDAVSELVANAVTHNDADVPWLSVAVDPAAGPEGMTELRIGDDGPGLPAAEVQALRRARDSQVLHSTGMGLWFVDWVITHSGGGLAIERADESGTELRLRLPEAEVDEQVASRLAV